jgi:acetyltransferase
VNNLDIIETFLHPKSVAVIGASKNPIKGGYRILNNLISNNFQGKIYPINPNADGKIFDLKFFSSVLDVEGDIDIAIFYIPNQLIPPVLKECIQKEIKGALIEASGFEEVGEVGIELKKEIADITDNFTKIRIVGPNCMGLTRIDSGINQKDKGGFFTSFAVFEHYKRGNIGVISQSGMLNGGYFTHIATEYPEMGFRYIASIGNKMDISENEFLEYYIKDPTVNVIAIYLESFKDPRRFIELCQLAKKYPKKTIILTKGGFTVQGQKASLSHTAAISEDQSLTKALIKQSGIIKANNFYDLFEYSRTFSMLYNTDKILPKDGSVSIIIGSGGAGTVLADLTKEYDIKLPDLSEEAYRELKGIFPNWMPPNRFSLVDIWPAMEKAMSTKLSTDQVMETAYKAVLGEENIEGLFNMLFCSKQFRLMSNVDLRIKLAHESNKPVFFYLIGEKKEVERMSKKLGENDIPSFSNLEDMVKNFKILVQESKNKKIDT